MSQSTVHMFVEPYRNEVCVSPCFLTWSTSANARLGPRKLHNVYCQRVHYALELLYLQQTKSLLRSWASFCSQIFSATVHNLLYLFILIQFFFNQPKKKKTISRMVKCFWVITYVTSGSMNLSLWGQMTMTTRGYVYLFHCKFRLFVVSIHINIVWMQSQY